jgi:hypothetical protein
MRLLLSLPIRRNATRSVTKAILDKFARCSFLEDALPPLASVFLGGRATALYYCGDSCRVSVYLYSPS